MQVCVYTTNHGFWLRHMRDYCGPDDLVCFRSNHRWAGAKQYLDLHGTLPVMIRETQDDIENLCCNYVAELVNIWFPDQFDSSDEKRAWLEEKLWLQRDDIKKNGPEKDFDTWEEQFEAWEIDKFMKASTFYQIRKLRAIEPLSLPNLTKVKGGEPLAENYVRGYSICHYPESKIRLVDAAPA